MKKPKFVEINTIRQAVADYMRSEGCSCCQNIEEHKEHEERLAELLEVPTYKDGSGYNFGKFETRREKGASR